MRKPYGPQAYEEMLSFTSNQRNRNSNYEMNPQIGKGCSQEGNLSEIVNGGSYPDSRLAVQVCVHPPIQGLRI